MDEHRPALTEKGELSPARGPLFLGVDLGASVAKMVLVDRDGCVLHAWCSKAFETPLTSLVSQHARLPLPAGSWIRACAATEGCVGRVRAALGETAITAVREDDALLRAVCTLVPETSLVIDAGGKEMRYLVVRGGRVDGLALDIACPADFCGFFEPLVEGRALLRDELVARALFACHPVDFGDRCTELTHEKVRDALKGGADRGDVAAGIVYAFARNTLGRMESPFRPWESDGELVVLGDIFANDALLRALELCLARRVHRPGTAGLMGALGAALLARDKALKNAAKNHPAAMAAEEGNDLSKGKKAR